MRSKASLKGILPGEERLFEISAGGDEPKLTLESDRLDDGQSIGFDAALEDLDGGR